MYQSFDALEKALISNQVLASPNPSHPIVLQTDASVIGIGAVLSLTINEGIDQPVAYYAQSCCLERFGTQLPSKIAWQWWGQYKALPYLPHWSSVYNSD